MRINNNIAAMNTQSRLASAQNAQAKSLEKLSSGLRINKAGDDAAGLAISEKMRGQIGGLNQAVRNAQDGISLIQTAEGGLNETHSILNRMRELAVQSANDTNTNDDRVEIQKEVNQLSQEIGRISTNTEFNEKKLLDGTFDGTFHIGANQGQNMSLEVEDMSSKGLGMEMYSNTVGNLEIASANKDLTVKFEVSAAITTSTEAAISGNNLTVTLSSADGTASNASAKDVMEALKSKGIMVEYAGAETGITTQAATAADVSINVLDTEYGIDVSSQSTANDAIKTIDNAISKVSAERSKLGAVQNRLDHTINNLTTTSENVTAAESRIRDVDMAKEMMNFTKNNILNQASTAMLAQANQMPQGVLQLLG